MPCLPPSLFASIGHYIAMLFVSHWPLISCFLNAGSYRYFPYLYDVDMRYSTRASIEFALDKTCCISQAAAAYFTAQ